MRLRLNWRNALVASRCFGLWFGFWMLVAPWFTGAAIGAANCSGRSTLGHCMALIAVTNWVFALGDVWDLFLSVRRGVPVNPSINWGLVLAFALIMGAIFTIAGSMTRRRASAPMR